MACGACSTGEVGAGGGALQALLALRLRRARLQGREGSWWTLSRVRPASQTAMATSAAAQPGAVASTAEDALLALAALLSPGHRASACSSLPQSCTARPQLLVSQAAMWPPAMEYL